jgi:hypothetical protein
MKIRHFWCWTYNSPVMDAMDTPSWSIDYYLPFILFNENKWNSKIVEAFTILIWVAPYSIWFAFLFTIQSLYMVPLYIYKGIYQILKCMDKYLL